jgi:hypothetical protein
VSGEQVAPVRADEASGEPTSECRVDLDGGHVSHPPAEQIGREPRPWPDFQDVVTKIPDAQDPGQRVSLGHLGPLRAGKELDVASVHGTVPSDQRPVQRPFDPERT